MIEYPMPPDQSHAALREEILRSEGVLTKQLMDARNRQLLAALERINVLERENSNLYSEIACVRSVAQRDSLRAELADQYEQWLLDLGKISGCGHVDDRLPRCVEEEFEKLREENARLRAENAVYESAVESGRKLARKIDVLINGESGAAKQASLCDLIGQIEELVRIRDVRQAVDEGAKRTLPCRQHDFKKAPGGVVCRHCLEFVPN